MTKMTARVAAILAGWLLAGGCSSVFEPGELVARDDVGAQGGTVASDDGDVTLTLPPGAVDEDNAIEISKLALQDLPAGVIPNTAFELDPDGAHFGKPVELSLRYRAEDLPNPDSRWLRVVQLLPDGKLGRTQFVAHDRDARQVKARLAHFSSYAIADLEVAQATFASSEERIDQVDLLVLVDNSRSMLGEQASLAANFPRLAAKLDQAGLDYRVGVISPDLGAGDYTFVETCRVGGHGGKLQTAPRKPGCPVPSDPWIAKHGDQSNVPGGDVAGAFACIAQLGANGCGFEQPLEAVHRAVDPETNPGFLRDDAALAVLLITDEDDCSARDTSLYDVRDYSRLGPANFRCFAQGIVCDGLGPEEAGNLGPRTDCAPAEDGLLHPMSRYVDRLRQLKPEGKVVVSLVAGPTEKVEVREKTGLGPAGEAGPELVPSCSSGVTAEPQSGALPAIRLKAFAEAFGADRSSFTSICQDDFRPALEQLGDLLLTAHKLAWCLPYDPEDTNPATPTLEADCVVEAGALGEVTACENDDSGPCYRVIENTECPGSSSQLELANATPQDPGQDQIEVTCLIP